MHVRWDLVGIGVATVDELLYVDEFPSPDAKTVIVEEDRQCGGLTATALVAAARFGAKCAYAGVLGTDSASDFIANALVSEGIDLSMAPRMDDAHPIHSRIIIDRNNNTRNIFFTLGQKMGLHPSQPIDEIVLSARALFLDHYGAAAAVHAVSTARSAGIPVIADLERRDRPCFQEILDQIDHVIVSERFGLQIAETETAPDAVRKLLTSSRETAIVTCGERGCYYADSQNQTVRNFPAFPIEVVDTTGCGDVFHGVYAACTALGMDLENRIRYATAAAALKATKNGAQRGIPTRQQIEAFLALSDTGATVA